MTARDRAADLIRRVLADGPVVAGAVERAAAAEGVSVRTTRRAAADLGVVRTRDGRHLRWALPTSQTAGDGTAPARHRRESHAASAVPAGAAPSDPGATSGNAEENDVNDTETNAPTVRVLRAVDDGLTVLGHVLTYGDVVVLDAEAVESTRDRTGTSWLDDLSTPAQLARWGRLMVREIDPAELDVPADDPGVSADDPAPVRREPITPAPLPHPRGFPSGRRSTPEGSVPFLVGLGGDGPVRIVADHRHAG